MARFRDLLVGAMAAVQADVPEAFSSFVAALPRSVSFEVDGERLVILSGSGLPSVEPGGAPGEVHIVTRRRDLLELIAGRQSFLDAVLSERVVITGEIRTLVQTHDALILLLRGIVRSPAAAGLLRELRNEEDDTSSGSTQSASAA